MVRPMYLWTDSSAERIDLMLYKVDSMFDVDDVRSHVRIDGPHVLYLLAKSYKFRTNAFKRT